MFYAARVGTMLFLTCCTVFLTAAFAFAEPVPPEIVSAREWFFLGRVGIGFGVGVLVGFAEIPLRDPARRPKGWRVASETFFAGVGAAIFAAALIRQNGPDILAELVVAVTGGVIGWRIISEIRRRGSWLLSRLLDRVFGPAPEPKTGGELNDP